jgi:hypothetical protein
MTTTFPMKISRPFRIGNEFAGQPERTAQIEVSPGRVTLRSAGELTWHQAQRYAAEVLEAARAARLLADLAAEASDVTRLCTVCNKEIRKGVVTKSCPSEPGRVRHVVGSPECSR